MKPTQKNVLPWRATRGPSVTSVSEVTRRGPRQSCTSSISAAARKKLAVNPKLRERNPDYGRGTRGTRIPLAVFAISVILLLSAVAYSLTLTGPTWSPSFAQRNTTLNCSWTNSTDTIAQNVTFFKNGAYYNSTYQNATLVNLSSFITLSGVLTRADVWTCQVTLYNGTDSNTSQTNITIRNSPPTTNTPPAGVFNSSGDLGYLVQIKEHDIFAVTVNATDPDNDPITYYAASSFCTQGSPTNHYSCAPFYGNLINNSPTLVNISFIVSDGSDFGGRIVTFNITPVNDPPVAVLTPQTTPVNVSLNYTFTVTDEESNFPLTLALVNYTPLAPLPRLAVTSLNGNGTQAKVTYDGSSVNFGDIGLWNISINISDSSQTSNGTNDSTWAVYNFTLNITPIGRKPYFTNITSNITLLNGQYRLSIRQTVQINFSANDLDANSTLTFLPTTGRANVTTIKSDTNTSDALGQANYTPGKADAGIYNVTISVRDATTLTNTTILQFNVTNINDPPTVNEMSFSAGNTLGNKNASALVAFGSTLFVYDVNATDPDIIYGYGDVLSYSSNSTLFTINATTGRISFTPSAPEVGAYDINVTVTDAVNNVANRTIHLDILANSPPSFNQTLHGLNCTTSLSCALALNSSTTDPDGGDYVAAYSIVFVGANLSSFAYNATTGLINFTPQKADVGNYTANITIFDTHGSHDSALMNITVNNTPVAPSLTNWDLGAMTIVETHLFAFQLQATDLDFLVPFTTENVTFGTNLTIAHTIIPLPRANATANALFSFTPSPGDAGNYTITINATDSFGLVSERNVTFTIETPVPPPNITTITPWGVAPNYTIQYTYENVTIYPANVALVNGSAGTTVLFNFTVNSTRALSYNWTIQNKSANYSTPAQVASSQDYTASFGYFDNDTYLVNVSVSDDRLNTVMWSWDLIVNHVPRTPTLVNPLLTPFTVNGTKTYADYFTLNNGTKFLNPDDDKNSNGVLDNNETNTLNFALTPGSVCSVGTVTIQGADLSITGTAVGSCMVNFTATNKDGLTAQSNYINISVLDVPKGDTQVVTSTSSGGGGGSATITIPIPISKKKETPKAFNLIAPKLVTIYDNKSVIIPITINNTWNGPLKFLRLTAKTNSSGVTTSFSQDFFETIAENETKDVKLTVSNYRLGENYEVLVTGNVSDPPYQDTALILLNSIEQSQEGKDVNVKVTFANDLLNEHPECQELNEILDQAKTRISEGNVKEGGRLVDSVINGCKYLVTMQQKVQEKPSRLNPIINIDDLSVKAIMLGVLAFVVLSSIAFLIYYHYSHNPEDDI